MNPAEGVADANAPHDNGFPYVAPFFFLWAPPFFLLVVRFVDICEEKVRILSENKIEIPWWEFERKSRLPFSSDEIRAALDCARALARPLVPDVWRHRRNWDLR